MSDLVWVVLVGLAFAIGLGAGAGMADAEHLEREDQCAAVGAAYYHGACAQAVAPSVTP